MADIKIVIDTSADMPPELIEKYDLGMVNFLTVFDETSYVAGVDINNDEFYRKIKEDGIRPTTAQTPYQDMYDCLLKESRENKTVIYFTISSKASGQNHTAHMVVEEIKEGDNPDADIRIVDTMNFSVYISSAVIVAAEAIKAGKSADEAIALALEDIKTWEAYLLVDDLNYLQKGGRITKTTAILGTLLDIKPVLTIRDGLVEPLDKLRGKKKVHKKLAKLIGENPAFDADKKEFMIVHSDKEAAKELEEALKEEFGDITVFLRSEFGPIIGTHAGPGCVAVLCRLK